MKPRLLKAFAISPLVAATAIAIANGLMGEGLATIPMGVLVYLPLSYLLVLPFGAIGFFGLRALNLSSPRAYAIAGTLLGVIVAVLLPLLMLGRAPTAGQGLNVSLLPISAAVGTLTGITFWRLAFSTQATAD